MVHKPSPSRHWLIGYNTKLLRSDLIAGLTTSAVVVPKCMAYAGIAGLPLEIGLYAGLLPMINGQ